MSDFHDLRDRRHDSGAHWVVDAAAGVVYGRDSKPIGRLTSNGYVAAERNGKQLRLHRHIWESVYGPIPPGLYINHINGIKTDNRIDNLELVTHQQNVAHRDRLGLRKAPRGEKHPRATIKEDDVKLIRRLYDAGVRPIDIARRYGFKLGAVKCAAYRASWKHLL